MKASLEFAGQDVRALRLCYEQGYSAAAAGLSIDGCTYQRADKRSAWLNGWHQGERDKTRPPPGAVLERVAHPFTAMPRAALGDIQKFAPGWHFEKGCMGHWFDWPDRKCLCGEHWYDIFFKPAEARHARCERCAEYLELRALPWEPMSPTRRAELERQLRALMGAS